MRKLSGRRGQPVSDLLKAGRLKKPFCSLPHDQIVAHGHREARACVLAGLSDKIILRCASRRRACLLLSEQKLGN